VSPENLKSAPAASVKQTTKRKKPKEAYAT
jgi:hypothetical protein